MDSKFNHLVNLQYLPLSLLAIPSSNFHTRFHSTFLSLFLLFLSFQPLSFLFLLFLLVGPPMALRLYLAAPFKHSRLSEHFNLLSLQTPVSLERLWSIDVPFF